MEILENKIIKTSENDCDIPEEKKLNEMKNLNLNWEKLKVNEKNEKKIVKFIEKEEIIIQNEINQMKKIENNKKEINLEPEKIKFIKPILENPEISQKKLTDFLETSRKKYSKLKFSTGKQ